jgi:Domain of unknown function (DUF397)
VQGRQNRPGVPGPLPAPAARPPQGAAPGADDDGLAWRRSRHCGDLGNCVEIAWRRGAEDVTIVVRDSKFPAREPLVFTPREWALFLGRVKNGDFDILGLPVAS